MNTSDLAASLRQLGGQLHRDGRFDPATESILNLESNGIVECGGRFLENAIGPVLRAARLQGAFDAPSVAGIGLLIDGNPFNPAMLEAVFRHLQSRGFPCWGVHAGCGAITKLADALDAIGLERQGRSPRPAQRRHRQTKPRKLTAKQLQAVEAFGKCECNYSATARMLGLAIPTARERIQAAYTKLGQTVPSLAKVQKLTADRRGGADIAAGPRPELRGDGVRQAPHDRRRG